MRILLTLSFLISAVSVIAGERVGNGGDVVVCENQVLMLDYAEVYGKDISYEKSGKPKDIVEYYLSRVAKEVDYKLQRALRRTTDKLIKGIELKEQGQNQSQYTRFTPNELSNLGDEGYFEIPIGCHIEQLIIRNRQHDSLSSEFIINKRLWEKMSDYQKAVAVLHEAYYVHMLIFKKGSVLARRFNSSTINGSLFELSSFQYLNMLNQFKLDSEVIIPHASGFLGFKRFAHNPVDDMMSDIIPHHVSNKITFFENGQISALTCNKNIQCFVYDEKLGFTAKVGHIKFDEQARMTDFKKLEGYGRYALYGIFEIVNTQKNNVNFITKCFILHEFTDCRTGLGSYSAHNDNRYVRIPFDQIKEFKTLYEVSDALNIDYSSGKTTYSGLVLLNTRSKNLTTKQYKYIIRRKVKINMIFDETLKEWSVD